MKPTLILLLLLSLTAATGPGKKPGKWTTLFDGKNLKGWHTYLKTSTEGWVIEDGAVTPSNAHGDLVTDKEYQNFDLEFEFKVPSQGNGGVIYKITESPTIKETYMSGPEYQVLDDKGYEWKDGQGNRLKLKDSQMTAAAYDIVPPADLSVVKPTGEWNKGRIVVQNEHVTHYLNGRKIVEYEYGSEAWKKLVAASKFATAPYATAHAKGKISLQGHGNDKVYYRNVRIQEGAM